jgi:hypothetical protein
MLTDTAAKDISPLISETFSMPLRSCSRSDNAAACA